MKLPEKIQYRPKGVRAAIAERCSEVGEASEIARRMAIRYAEVMQASLPYFTGGEWGLIVERLREVQEIGEVLRTLEDALKLHSAAESHESVDGLALLTRLQSLPTAELAALLDYSDRYWAGNQRGDEPQLNNSEGYRWEASADYSD